ncbi:hypothetical protein IKG54_01930, partial [Candidatus Saccharibacteria bacterium]|nr:hypothetical protein [Candidatus Saccharibacteria bacterium]
LFRVYATFSVAFLLAFISSSLLTPAGTSSAVDCTNNLTPSGDICGSDTTDVNVSDTGAWTVSISSSGTLNVDVTPSGSGTTSTATDNVNVYTNTPNGYQLYLNSTSGSTDIYNNSDTEHERNHFIATTGTKDSPIALSSNSWGYSLSSNPTTFSKVETSSSAADSLISSGSKTSGSGDNLYVTYGFNADTKLTPGTYTTSVTYTAVAEVPSYTISSVSPNNFSSSDTNQPITIVTTTPSTELGLGDITARITDSTGTNTVNLTNCTETTVTVSGTSYRAASCTYPGGLPVSINNYNVELTSSWHSATYTLPNSITIYQTTMQNFTQTNCNNLIESTATEDHRTRLKDIRDGKFYNVSKLADGNCWMVQNLALDGGRTLTPADSNVTQNRILPVNKTLAQIEYTDDAAMIYSGAADSVDSYGSKYGNYYNWKAATATIGVASQGSTTYESICPLGWQLPNYSGQYSYYSLFSNYTFSSPTDTRKAPLSFPLGGLISTSQHSNIGLTANYHTRTGVSSGIDWQLYFHFESSTPRFLNYFGTAYVISVRCVFGS